MDRLLIRMEVLPLPLERDLRLQLREHLGNGQVQSHPNFLLCRIIGISCVMDYVSIAKGARNVAKSLSIVAKTTIFPARIPCLPVGN